MINQRSLRYRVYRAVARVCPTQAIAFEVALLVGVPACAHVSPNQTTSPVTQTPPRGVTASSGAANGSISGLFMPLGTQSTSAGCPGGNGIHISANSGTGNSDGSASNPLAGTESSGGLAGKSVTGTDTTSRSKLAAANAGASRSNSASANDSAARASNGPGLNVALDQRNSIDTTLVFDVAQKTWTRTNLAAAITAGLADQNRGGYAICAGITALIPSANLTINGARGRVHFAATLQSLLNSIQPVPAGTTSQLRRM
jgi:hypothetical protein